LTGDLYDDDIRIETKNLILAFDLKTLKFLKNFDPILFETQQAYDYGNQLQPVLSILICKVAIFINSFKITV